MGRRTTSTSFVTPIKSDGTTETEDATEFGLGSYTLASGTTYYYPLGGADSPFISAHVQWDASIVITSITVEDCNFPEPRGLAQATGEVAWHDDAAGQWIDEDPSTAFVGSDGAGVTVTNGVVAVAGGAQGGCMIHVTDTAARRTRLKVVVGGTGGELRVATWSKE